MTDEKNVPNFKRCEELATKLLSTQKLCSSKITVKQLAFDKNIIFDSIQNYAKIVKNFINKDITDFISKDTNVLSDGCHLYDRDNNLYIVLYNSDCECDERLNWTLAHEIGHIYLGHENDGPIEEIEAHFFAAQLIAPINCLAMIELIKGNITANDIYNLFYISKEASEKRLATYKKRTSYESTENDDAIYHMISRDILDYCERMKKNPLIVYNTDNEFISLENTWLYREI